MAPDRTGRHALVEASREPSQGQMLVPLTISHRPFHQWSFPFHLLLLLKRFSGYLYDLSSVYVSRLSDRWQCRIMEWNVPAVPSPSWSVVHTPHEHMAMNCPPSSVVIPHCGFRQAWSMCYTPFLRNTRPLLGVYGSITQHQGH